MAPGSRQALGAHPFLFPAWQTLPLTPASWGLSPASTSAPPAAAPASCQTPPKQGEEANGVALVKGDRTAMAHGCPAPPCVLLGPPLPTLLEPAVATWATAAPARRAPSIARAAHPAPSSSRAERRSLHDTQHPKATCLVPSLVTFIICVTITTCLNTSPFFSFFFFPFPLNNLTRFHINQEVSGCARVNHTKASSAAKAPSRRAHAGQCCAQSSQTPGDEIPPAAGECSPIFSSRSTAFPPLAS